MNALNTALFNLINAPAAPSGTVLAVAQFLADKAIFLVAAALVLGWIRGGLKVRSKLFVVGLTAVIGLGANLTIASLWAYPRPFVTGLGHQFLPHVADSSFPSDHATILFAVALGLFAARATAFWSWGALILAAGVAWSRVYVGVHWPLDMAGSVVVAGVAALSVPGIMATRPGRALCRAILAFYDRVLNALRIPNALSPRSHG